MGNASGISSTDGTVQYIKVTDHALHTLEQGTAVGADVLRNRSLVLEEAPYYVVSVTGATVIKNSAGAFYGYTALSSVSTGLLNFYDGLSTTGQPITAIAGLGIAASTETLYPVAKQFATGLTVNINGALQASSTTSMLVWYK